MKRDTIIFLMFVVLFAYAGSASADGTEAGSNNYFGLGAGQFDIGIDNSFFGLDAGRNNTGSSNSFFGVDAGRNNTGYGNSFFGVNAGYNNVNGGSNNSFFGISAGYNNTGFWNTFIGYNAGFFNTDGNWNTFIGYEAGRLNKTGNRNTFTGMYAGSNVEDGTGDNNTFNGYNAGHNNTTGDNNAFVGFSAGVFNTTGDNNTSYGAWAGNNNSTGTGNVFLGYMAGYNEEGSNTLYIANSDGDPVPPLIYGEFDNQLLEINGDLEVNGDLDVDDDLDVAGTVTATSFVGNITGSETDPVFILSDSYDITATQITNWGTAYGWGDHASAEYLTSYTETDPDFDASPSSGITSTQITNWDTAFGWGDHPVGANTINYLPKWNGSALVKGSIYDNGNVGIGTSTPTEALDISGNSMRIGSDSSATTRTNATAKAGIITVPHYLTAEEDVYAFGLFPSAIGNQMRIGGGNNSYNSATAIDFRTGDTYNELMGKTRLLIDTRFLINPDQDDMDLVFRSTGVSPLVRFDSGADNVQILGDVGIGTTMPSDELQVAGNIRANGYKSTDGSEGIDKTINLIGSEGACTLTIEDGLITGTDCPES